MPRYDYECSSCGASFEWVRAMQDADPACPTCSSERVLRRFSVFATTGASSGMQAAPASPSPGGCACGGACACR